MIPRTEHQHHDNHKHVSQCLTSQVLKCSYADRSISRTSTAMYFKQCNQTKRHSGKVNWVGKKSMAPQIKQRNLLHKV